MKPKHGDTIQTKNNRIGLYLHLNADSMATIAIHGKIEQQHIDTLKVIHSRTKLKDLSAELNISHAALLRYCKRVGIKHDDEQNQQGYVTKYLRTLDAETLRKDLKPATEKTEEFISIRNLAKKLGVEHSTLRIRIPQKEIQQKYLQSGNTGKRIMQYAITLDYANQILAAPQLPPITKEVEKDNAGQYPFATPIKYQQQKGYYIAPADKKDHAQIILNKSQKPQIVHQRLISPEKEQPTITIKALCLEIGISEHGLKNHCKRHNIKRKINRISLNDAEKIRAYYDNPKGNSAEYIPIRNIVKKYNISKYILLNHCKKNAIPIEQKKVFIEYGDDCRTITITTAAIKKTDLAKLKLTNNAKEQIKETTDKKKIIDTQLKNAIKAIKAAGLSPTSPPIQIVQTIGISIQLAQRIQRYATAGE